MDFAACFLVLQMLTAAESWRVPSLGPILLSFQNRGRDRRSTNALERHARTGRDTLADDFRRLILAAAGSSRDLSAAAAVARRGVLAALENHVQILDHLTRRFGNYRDGDESIPVTSAAVLGVLARAVVLDAHFPTLVGATDLAAAEEVAGASAARVAELIPVCGQARMTWKDYTAFRAWALQTA